jgi:NADH-quinone oxidoreductase subunit J
MGGANLVAAATIPDALTFAIAAVICVVGAFGVVLMRNPVHAALSLVMTLFGIAVLFVEEDAQFLAAVQVIVYTGAIVVLFLFVIMLLGVDRKEKVLADVFKGQRLIAMLLGLMVLAEVILLGRGRWTTGAHGATKPITSSSSNVVQLGRALFTSYLIPFEATSALLIVAVIGAVVLARRPSRSADAPPADSDEPVLPAPVADAPLASEPDGPADANPKDTADGTRSDDVEPAEVSSR